MTIHLKPGQGEGGENRTVNDEQHHSRRNRPSDEIINSTNEVLQFGHTYFSHFLVGFFLREEEPLFDFFCC
jgi:hypothetical protein